MSLWFDMQDEGDNPDYARLLTRVECPQQKRLIVWIEEHSPHRTSKKTAVRGPGTESAEESLRRVIDRFKWRRRCDAHQAFKSRLVESPSEAAKLNADSLEVLEQAARFHRDRAAK